MDLPSAIAILGLSENNKFSVSEKGCNNVITESCQKRKSLTVYINPHGILDNIPDDPGIISLAGQIQSIMLGLGNVIEDTNGLSRFPCRYFLMRIVVSSDSQCICDLLS